jgi:hypothetical protein
VQDALRGEQGSIRGIDARETDTGAGWIMAG